jgi:hypothetical protein
MVKKKLIWFAVVSAFFISCSVLAEDINVDADLTQKIEKIIKDINTIKPGMTRGDLMKLFTTEGGISSRTWRRYVHKSCPYIKVDVEFASVGDMKSTEENNNDIIVKISQPFLELTIND